MGHEEMRQPTPPPPGSALPEAVFDAKVEIGPGGALPEGWHDAAMTLHGSATNRQGVLLVRAPGLQVGFPLQATADADGALALTLDAAACVGARAASCHALTRASALEGALVVDSLTLRGAGIIRQLRGALRSDLYREPHDGFRPSTDRPPWPPPLAERPDPVLITGAWFGYVFALPTVFAVDDPLAGAGCGLTIAPSDAGPLLQGFACSPRADFERFREHATELEPVALSVDLSRRDASVELIAPDARWRLSGSLDSQLVQRDADNAHRLYRFFGRLETAPLTGEGAWQLAGSFALSSWGMVAPEPTER